MNPNPPPAPPSLAGYLAARKSEPVLTVANHGELQQLNTWLMEQAMIAGNSCDAWKVAAPGCEQQHYRSGMSWAFIEVMRKIEQLDPTIKPFGQAMHREALPVQITALTAPPL